MTGAFDKKPNIVWGAWEKIKSGGGVLMGKCSQYIRNTIKNHKK